MRGYAKQAAGLLALMVLVLISGCQSLLGGSSVPGVKGGSKKEIAKLAKNDPFPTPEQVGLLMADE